MALALLSGGILVDIFIKSTNLQNWEQYKQSSSSSSSDDDNNNNNIDRGDTSSSWTPSAQSKSRLFWQAPIPGKRGGGNPGPSDKHSSIHKQKSFEKWTSSKVGQKCLNWLFSCKKILRYMFEKTTIYVLECEHGKYYVGSTVNIKRRMQQHFENSRGGSMWTKKHKPIRVLQVYRRIPYRYKLGFESQVTSELMWEKGINNVRGAMFLYARDYTLQDLNSLVSFIGHYNDLSYRYVRIRLNKELVQQGGGGGGGGSNRNYNNSVVGNAKSRRREKRRNLQKEYNSKVHQTNNNNNKAETSNIKNESNSLVNNENTIESKRQKDARNRYQGGGGNNNNNNDNKNNNNNEDTAASDTVRQGDHQYKAMDEWLNRKKFDDDDDDEPKTIEDL